MLIFLRYLCLTICVIECGSCGFPRPADVIGDAESDGQDSGGNQAPSFPSCGRLHGTCGSAKDSCCTTLDVPGGSYFRSYDFLGDPASGDTHDPAKISSFRLDKYEVTVGRFRAFVQAGMGTQIQPPVVGTGLHPN